MQTLRRRRLLHREQANFLRDRSLYRGFVGGRGSGKTWVGAYDMLIRARKDRTYLIGSPTGVLLHDTTFPTFKLLAQEIGLWGPVILVEVLPEVVFNSTGESKVKMTPYPTVELTTGATIRFRTAEDPEKMRGPNLSGCWLDEGSLMPKESFLINIATLREKGEQGWLTSTFTPKGLSHWTYETFGRGTPNTAIFHAATRDNPFNPPGFHDQLAIQYGTGLRAEQELDGRFCNTKGAEWPPEYFSDDLWFGDWPASGWAAKAMALDPSKGRDRKKPKEGRDPDYSAWVWGAVDRAGKVWIDADLDNVRDVTRIVEDGLAHYRRFQPSAICVEINVFQELIAGEIARRAGQLRLGTLPLYGINNTEPKEVRIRTIGPYLAQRELRFRDTPGCRRLVQQLRDFPCGTHDDGPDALVSLLRMLLFQITGQAEGAGQPKLLRP